MSTTEVPLGLKWSHEEAEKAAKKWAFLSISETDKRTYRHLSGAEKMWKQAEKTGTEPEMYLLKYRMVGTLPALQKALTAAGIAPDEVEKALKNSITATNFATTKKSEVQEEMSGWKTYRGRAEKKVPEAMDWKTVLAMASHIKSAQIVLKEEKRTPSRGRDGGGESGIGGGGRGKKLLEKYEEISGKEGKVLDVSHMEEDGTGVRVQNKPSTDRGQKVFLEGVPLISKDLSRYLHALSMLQEHGAFESLEQYKQAVRMAEVKFAAKKKK